jgi:hypothetical protein
MKLATACCHIDWPRSFVVLGDGTLQPHLSQTLSTVIAVTFTIRGVSCYNDEKMDLHSNKLLYLPWIHDKTHGKGTCRRFHRSFCGRVAYIKACRIATCPARICSVAALSPAATKVRTKVVK